MWPTSAHHHAEVAPVTLEAKLSEVWVLRHSKADHSSAWVSQNFKFQCLTSSLLFLLYFLIVVIENNATFKNCT